MKRLLKTVAVAALLTGAASMAQAEQFIRIVSGPAGGSWYPLGAAISEIFNKNIEGVASSNGPGGGVGNIKDVSKGNAEVGWSYGHTAYNGVHGRGAFDGKQYPNVRYMATLYPASLQTAVPANSSIKSYADMKDKNLSPGKAQWSGFAAFKMVFGEYGLTVEDVKKNGGTIHHVSYSDSVALMKDGHIDAFTGLTSLPQASFLDLEFSPGIRMIGVEKQILDKILKENPGYIRSTITSNEYKSVKEPVETLGAVTVMVVNKDLPDDVVYNMTKALWEHHGDLVKVKSVWESVKLEDGLLGAAIDIHPGAKRFYDEKGVKVK
jgi:TRAP transporter TAXI family solute receptor